MKKKIIKKIAMASTMTAFAVVLNLISVRTDTSLITIYALPLLLSGILFGPLTGFLTGIATGIIVQLFTYGLGPTTIIWILAPMSWGLVSGLVSKLFKNKINAFTIIVNVFLSSLISLSLNTLAMVLDGLYYDYPTQYVWANLYIRIATSCLVGVFYGFVLNYSLKTLNKINPLQKEQQNKKEVNKLPKNKYKIKLKIDIKE